MRECDASECTLPSWSDGVDESKCVGHQPTTDPFVQDMILDGIYACIQCGVQPPTPMAFYDKSMPGELLCTPCATELQATIRLNIHGENY